MNPVIQIKSLYIHGLETRPVTIEVLKSRGLAQLHLTGLPDSWLRDSRDKVKSLISRIAHWGSLDRLLVHMLPADEPKTGAHLELPILLACIAALKFEELSSESLSFLKRYSFVGALSLQGDILSTEMEQLSEIVRQQNVLGSAHFATLDQLWEQVLKAEVSFAPKVLTQGSDTSIPKESSQLPAYVEPHVKVLNREWEQFWIFMASLLRMPVLLMGAPGVGKSLLARWSHALSSFDREPYLREIAHIWRIAALPRRTLTPLIEPHARSPLSEFVGMQRAGHSRPGYFSLAHGGLLVCDEFSELNRDCREILRNVLDQKVIHKNVRGGSMSWPADFWLIATSNPCPCGFSVGQNFSKCQCLASVRIRYRSRISGPIFERLALRLFVKQSLNPEEKEDLKLLKGWKANSVEQLRNSQHPLREKISEHFPQAAQQVAADPFFEGLSYREINSKVQLLAVLMAYWGVDSHESMTLLKALTRRERKDFELQERFFSL